MSKSFLEFFNEEYLFFESIKYLDKHAFLKYDQGAFDKAIISEAIEFADDNQEREWIKTYRNAPDSKEGQVAINALIENKIPYVKDSVRRLLITHPHLTKEDAADAEALGINAIFQAAQKYDINSNVPFTKYASQYVFAAIHNDRQLGVNHGRKAGGERSGQRTGYSQEQNDFIKAFEAHRVSKNGKTFGAINQKFEIKEADKFPKEWLEGKEPESFKDNEEKALYDELIALDNKRASVMSFVRMWNRKNPDNKFPATVEEFVKSPMHDQYMEKANRTQNDRKTTLVSVDQEVSGKDDDAMTLGNVVPDTRSSADTSGTMDKKLVNALIENFISKLPSHEAKVLEMSFFSEKKSKAEIAKELGLTSSIGVTVILQRVLKKLREYLEKYNLTAEDLFD